MIKPDTKYDGVVGTGSSFLWAQTGTRYYNVRIECVDGVADFPIWLTPNNRQRAINNFAILGVSLEQLGDQQYVQERMSNDIAGRRIAFGTKEDSYNNRSSVRVSWIGRVAEGDPAAGASAYFSGSTTTDEQAGGFIATDDDLPF